jgi:hypothetical protein
MALRSRYRLICPDCGATIITGNPEAVIWELCPACRRHTWDLFDARMADKVNNYDAPLKERSRHAEN